MKKNKAGFASQAIQAGLLMAAVAAPIQAFAQFTVIDQHARVFVMADSGPSIIGGFNWDAESLHIGDLSSQNLSAMKSAGTDVTVHGEAHFKSIATPTVVGISKSMALTFNQVAAEIPANLTVAGQVTVIGSLTFTVDTATDVLISGSGASFSRVAGIISGATTIGGEPAYMLMPVQSTNGQARLTAGTTYHLSINADYHPPSTTSGPVIIFGSDGTVSSGMGKFVMPTSLVSSGFSGVTITAVPEPATALLSLLGLAGIATVARRRATR